MRQSRNQKRVERKGEWWVGYVFINRSPAAGSQTKKRTYFRAVLLSCGLEFGFVVVDEFGDEWAVMGQPKQIVEIAQYGAEEQGNGDGTPETQVEPGAQNEANKNGNWSNGKVSHLVGPATVQG
jgi:hypothetical protein